MKLSKQAKKFLAAYDNVQRTSDTPISIQRLSSIVWLWYQSTRRFYLNLVSSGHIKNKIVRASCVSKTKPNPFFVKANEIKSLQLKVVDEVAIKKTNDWANEIETLALILLGKDLWGTRVLEVARDLYEISKEMRI